MGAGPCRRLNGSRFPGPGSVGVELRDLLRRGRRVIANLRFAEHATIDEHSADFDIDVIRLCGGGFVSVNRNAVPFSCGELIAWPAGVIHCLWTEASSMETLMVEHHKA